MALDDGNRPLAEAFRGLYSNSEHIDYAVIDAFTDVAYKGNPAAVILLPQFRDTEWMQSVAAEFNLSETCYLVKKETKVVEDAVAPETESLNDSTSLDLDTESTNDSEAVGIKHVIHEYDLRWFTPTAEVDLCGHATLAAAFVLFEAGKVGKEDTVFFHTKSGLLSVKTVAPKDNETRKTTDMVEMNFPWITTTPSTSSGLEKLASTLGNVDVVAVGKANHNLVIELATKEDLEKLRPNMQELLSCDSDGLYATAPGSPVSEVDFVTRCFFPKLGVDEDPVCGSAHAALAPYWSTKLGKDNLVAYQASKRGGTLALQVDKKIGRVYIRGQCTMVMAGGLLK